MASANNRNSLERKDSSFWSAKLQEVKRKLICDAHAQSGVIMTTRHQPTRLDNVTPPGGGFPDELSSNLAALINQMGRTMYHQLEGPVNALCINSKNASLCAVAGRNVFKIFTIEEDEFVEKLNLRNKGKKPLTYSCLDVAWNPTEEHILASAATNGAVVVWNINLPSTKQEYVFSDHRRTVNKVSFHPQDAHYLLSGSQDGLMKLFDLRQHEAAQTFRTQLESPVRDVQFSPHNYNSFAAAYETGNIQIWDLRRTDRSELQLSAHSGPVFALDWHPDQPRWIASAGRDKTIKVWETGTTKSHCTHTIQTIAEVQRIKWRPHQVYHIASCALIVDFNVNVWDIRRPYIPFAQFGEHKDVVTGIVWKNDPSVFLSCGKDSRLYQHMFRDAHRPAEQANPIGIDLGVGGQIAHACSDKIVTVNASKNAGANYAATRVPSFFKRGADRTDQFTGVSSSLYLFSEENLSMNWFVESALNYQLQGKPFEELCEHNANVATKLNRKQVAQSWRMLKLVYATNLGPSTTRDSQAAMMPNERNADTEREKLALDNSHADSKTDNEGKDKADILSTGVSDESDEDEKYDRERQQLTQIASGVTHQPDLFFGDGVVGQVPFDMPNGAFENDELWVLPSEAFQPRHEINTGAMGQTSPGHQENGEPDSPDSTSDNDFSPQPNLDDSESNQRNELTLRVLPQPISATMDFSETVLHLLNFYAENGDIQMTVSAMLVLGKKILLHISEQTQEQWLMSYLDLLSRFQLYGVSTRVINLSAPSNVQILNQQSTLLNMHCNVCGKGPLKNGWMCEKCKRLTSTCSICHLPVRGVYTWCQGCGHGGHINHIQTWLLKHPECPTGCGHLCEYT